MLPPLKVTVRGDGIEEVNAGLTKVGNTAQVQGARIERSMRGARMQTANLAAQFNDIGVMLAAGQSPLMLAVQQGTQINQVLNQMGSRTQILRGLGSAFTSIINPVSLLTIGVIAGGAALVQWGMSALGATEEAKKFEEALETVRSKTVELQNATRQLQLGFATPEELAIYDRIAQVSLQIEAVQQRIANGERLRGNSLGKQIQQLQQQRSELEGHLVAIDDARRKHEQVSAQLERSRDHAAAIAELERAVTWAGWVAQTDLIAANLGAAAQNAWDMANAAAQAAEASRQLEVMEVAGQYEAYGQGRQAFDRGAARQRYSASGRAFARPRGGRGGGRSGGGGGGGVNPLIAELEAVQQALMTQEQSQLASFERQQETLENALAQKLLTTQEYNAAIEAAQQQHSEKMSQIDVYRYGAGIQQAEAFFGQMANAMQAGNNKMARIGQAFAAIESLINAYRAFNQVLADPSLPWFAKIPAATAVLASGLQTVAAIRSIGASASGGGGAAAAVAGGGGAANVQTSRTVRLQIDGLSATDLVSGAQVRGILSQINELQRDGGQIVLV